MAQVRVTLRGCVLAAFCALASSAYAQAPVPETALAAEGAERWEEALQIYHQTLAAEPGRADLWVRVANIESRLERHTDAVTSLLRAAAAVPNDADVRARLSRAHAVANQPIQALEAIKLALAMRPNDVEFLRAAGQLSSWNADYSGAVRYYRRLLVLHPTDADAQLHVARNLSWVGNTEAAAAAYRDFVAGTRDSAAAWLELATVESWRGNHSGALEALRGYASRFGTTSNEYAVTLARVYAGAGRAGRAVALLDPLYARDPKNYDVAAARTVALTMKRSVGAARESLAALRRLDAANAQTRDTARLVRATLGSRVEPGFTFYADSDHLRTIGITPSGTLLLSTATQLSGGYSRFILEGRTSNGLGTSTGSAWTHEEVWGALAQSFGPVTLSARMGSVTDDDSLKPYAVGASFRMGDALTFAVERSENFVLISPRTAELGLTDLRHRGTLLWTPTMSTTIAVDGGYQDFSDGNRRWEARVAPRRAVVRNSHLNMDLGVEVYRLETDHDFGNGYYDPQRYESYQGAVYPYLKLGSDVGVAFSLALGGQREFGKPFRMGGSASGELTVGIYRAWLLRISGGTTHNLRQESGAFRGYNGGAVLVRRF